MRPSEMGRSRWSVGMVAVGDLSGGEQRRTRRSGLRPKSGDAINHNRGSLSAWLTHTSKLRFLAYAKD